MNRPIATFDPSTLLTQLARPQLCLFYGVDEPTPFLLRAVVHWAARGGEVRVLDGANHFDGYFVARAAYRWSPEPTATLERIRLSRAFTCFQLAQRIDSLPIASAPTVILGFLNTFYDESVPLAEAQRLLDQTLMRLKALALRAPVVVSAAEPRALVKDRWTLLERLQLAADTEWTPALPAPAPGPTQLPLVAAGG